MKRVEFTISSESDESLTGPAFVEDCSELPLAIMKAVEDFLEAHEGQLVLPLTIQVRPSAARPTC
jgi:hypothetical protein